MKQSEGPIENQKILLEINAKNEMIVTVNKHPASLNMYSSFQTICAQGTLKGNVFIPVQNGMYCISCDMSSVLFHHLQHLDAT